MVSKRGSRSDCVCAIMSDSDEQSGPELFDDAEDAGEWWNQEIEAAKKGERRWETLKHNGVLFPPPYVPHGIPILYEGKKFEMNPEEEELATMFAEFREHFYYQQPQFRSNFFKSWLAVLDRSRPRGHPIRKLEYCDFDLIWEHIQRQREAKKNLSREEKKQRQAEKKKLEAPYTYCLWNGKKEKLANFRIEPPGLFRGRGEHPLRGCLKPRVQPEDVTINIGENEKVPPPPPGHTWKEVVHDHNVTWLAMWQNTLTGQFKYVMLGASSSVKGLSDRAKFERARELDRHIGRIREEYREWFSSKDLEKQQMAVAIYFIDRLALRVGNEKKEDEADTVGCCSLKNEHVQCVSGENKLYFNFLGKDSIRYENTVEVDPQVYALVARLKSAAGSPYNPLFGIIKPEMLNEHFKRYMPDLSAKVFRTYNASKTLQEYFVRHPWDPSWTVDQKMAYFTKANTEVAILCNHQRTASKQQLRTMSSMSCKIDSMKRALGRLKEALRLGGSADAIEKLFHEQDEEQREWLRQYGTEEEKESFEKEVANRVIPSGSASSPSKPRHAVKRNRRTMDDLEEEDDKPLSQLLASTPPPPARRPPRSTTKTRGVKKEDATMDDDDNQPLASLDVCSSTNNKAGAHEPVKKDTSDDDADDEGGDHRSPHSLRGAKTQKKASPKGKTAAVSPKGKTAAAAAKKKYVAPNKKSNKASSSRKAAAVKGSAGKNKTSKKALTKAKEKPKKTKGK